MGDILGAGLLVAIGVGVGVITGVGDGVAVGAGVGLAVTLGAPEHAAAETHSPLLADGAAPPMPI